MDKVLPGAPRRRPDRSWQTRGVRFGCRGWRSHRCHGGRGPWVALRPGDRAEPALRRYSSASRTGRVRRSRPKFHPTENRGVRRRPRWPVRLFGRAYLAPGISKTSRRHRPDDDPVGMLRRTGFNAGSEIWFSDGCRARKDGHGVAGGTPRPFLTAGDSTPAWSPDNASSRSSARPRAAIPCLSQTARAETLGRPEMSGQGQAQARGVHTHNPVWSPDDKWIYVVHGTGTGPSGRNGHVAY